MNEITVREVTREEIPQMVEWLYAHKQINQLDIQPFRDNQCRIFVVEDQTGILCFIPVQYLYLYGALAPRPDLAPFRMERVCEEMTRHIKKLAKEENIGAIIVQPSDNQFSKCLQNLGYGPITQETLSMKFGQEKKSTETA